MTPPQALKHAAELLGTVKQVDDAKALEILRYVRGVCAKMVASIDCVLDRDAVDDACETLGQMKKSRSPRRTTG